MSLSHKNKAYILVIFKENFQKVNINEKNYCNLAEKMVKYLLLNFAVLCAAKTDCVNYNFRRIYYVKEKMAA